MSNFSSLTGKKILIVNDHAPSYAGPFEHLGLEVIRNHDILKHGNTDDVALVVFTGGSDVSPYLYDKPAHHSTFANMDRDLVETEVFDIARGLDIPMAGICRGAQLLCVMAGGKLVQDITGHGSSHTVMATYPDGSVREIAVSSSHHQMQYPFGLPDNDYQVLATATSPRSKHYTFCSDSTIQADEADERLKSEPDVVFYPKIKALGAQYHPEWMQPESDGFKYFQELVSYYLVPLMKERYESEDGAGEKTTQTAG